MLTRDWLVVSSSPINGYRCFIEQERLPLLLVNGAKKFLFLIRTKINAVKLRQMGPFTLGAYPGTHRHTSNYIMIDIGFWFGFDDV